MLSAAVRERNTIAMVAEYGGKVLGFMVYELHKTRIELLRLAVRPGFRREGVGRQIVAKLVGKLGVRRDLIALHVRESCLDAQLFLRDCGFRAVDVVRGCYADTGEDAYRFVYRVAAEEPAVARECEGVES